MSAPAAGSIGRRAPLVGVALAFAAFISLGLPEGTLGTVWPDMRSDLGRNDGDLRFLLVGYVVGYLVSSIGAGAAVVRFGVRHMLAGGLLTASAGLALYSVSSHWGLSIAAALVVGLGAGPIDTAVNAWATVRGSHVMNFVHGFFGIGTTLGPLLVRSVLGFGANWRWVFATIAIIDLTLAIAIIARGPTIERSEIAEEDAAPAPTGRFRALAVLLLYFAIYVAIEVSAGAWGYSLLTEERGFGDNAAAFVIAGYWLALTVGRFALGLIAYLPSVGSPAPRSILRISVVAIVAASAALWATESQVVSAVALPLLGLSLAGVFPALMLSTPGWVGEDLAPHAIGWALAASAIGSVGLAVFIGWQADNFGFTPVVADIAVLALALVGLQVVSELWLTDGPPPPARPPASRPAAPR